ncbi:hypothetical protein T439DRAFT_322565 [Meredithblackwellia eburnea MCA 4105]
MRGTTTAVVAVLTVVGRTSAQSSVTSALGGLSTNCQTAATSLLTSSFGTCVNVLGLVNVLSASGSIISPLNSWLSGACSQTCSSSTLSTASSTIESGCSTDIQNGTAIAVGLETLTTNYTAVKNVLCLQAVSNSTFCLSNLLTAVQTATGTNVTTSTVTSLLTDGVSSLTSLLSEVPASSLCTDCTHAMVSKLQVLASSTSTSSSSALSAVSSECGASFVDGSIPSTVQEASSSNSSSSASASASSSKSAVSSTSLSAAGRVSVGQDGLGKATALALFVTLGGAIAAGAWTL